MRFGLQMMLTKKTKLEMRIDKDGTKRWYLNDKLHREDGHAVEYADGIKEWYLDGKLHREDGPAVEFVNGSKYWYWNGKLIFESEWKEKISNNNLSKSNLDNLSQEEKRFLLSLIRKEQRELKDEMELWLQHRSSASGGGVCPTMFRNPNKPPDIKYIDILSRLEYFFSRED